MSADLDTLADVAESLTGLSISLNRVHAARALMTQDPIQYKRQSQLGQITEMIHVARYESSHPFCVTFRCHPGCHAPHFSAALSSH